MGSSNIDSKAEDNEQPQHTIYLPTYYVGKRPVSTREYLSKTILSVENISASDFPVVNVNWQDAFMFAHELGMTLPNEAEWEKASRGSDGRIYPWGNNWVDSYANVNESYKGLKNLWGRLTGKRVSSGLTSIGLFSPKGDSFYGCLDMAGNIWEWTQSLYRNYPYILLNDREELNSNGEYVMRGGSFADSYEMARCASRKALAINFSMPNCGFRVAVSPIIDA